MLKKGISLYLFITFSVSALTQEKITNEDIWTNLTYHTNTLQSLNFTKDGKHYTTLEDNVVYKYDLVNGEEIQELASGKKYQGLSNFTGNISDYHLDQTETKLMVATDTERLYRRNTASRYHVIDLSSNNVIPVFEGGKIMHATFSPTAEKVAFVNNNNLYYTNLKNRSLTQITFDGTINSIINGSADWVYQEEFMLTKAFEWSEDGSKIAFLKFDESNVKEYSMGIFNNTNYPDYEVYKYPKTGEHISKVSIHVYDVPTGKTSTIDLGIAQDHYIPSIQWTRQKDKLAVTILNRKQNRLQLVIADLKSQAFTVVINEENEKYIDIPFRPIFLKNKEEFIWSSEISGFNHLYLFDLSGEVIKDLTPGSFDVSGCYGLDEKRNILYYQASKNSTWDKQIYAVNLAGKYDTRISKKAGFNSAQFSSSFDYYVLEHSTINDAPTYDLYDRLGKYIRTIESNDHIPQLQSSSGARPFEFFTFQYEDSIDLNGWVVKPEISPGKKYPVLMYVYGGPGSQEVVDAWKGDMYWWFQTMVQNGYIIACIDGRGTGARGEQFKKATYKGLGYLESLDQIAAAKYLSTWDFVDQSRIGIYGWSYGGFTASHCLFRGNGAFKLAIAIAPATDWKWYNTVFSERYMGTIEENPRGYDNSSLLNYAHLLEGNYLLIHGMADDNVHFQHTAELTNALIRANKQFDMYIYPNRNHGIYGDNARLHLFTKMTNFIINNL